jgi:hypothetical protein
MLSSTPLCLEKARARMPTHKPLLDAQNRQPDLQRWKCYWSPQLLMQCARTSSRKQGRNFLILQIKLMCTLFKASALSGHLKRFCTLDWFCHGVAHGRLGACAMVRSVKVLSSMRYAAIRELHMTRQLPNISQVVLSGLC